MRVSGKEGDRRPPHRPGFIRCDEGHITDTSSREAWRNKMLGNGEGDRSVEALPHERWYSMNILCFSFSGRLQSFVKKSVASFTSSSHKVTVNVVVVPSTVTSVTRCCTGLRSISLEETALATMSTSHSITCIFSAK